MFRCTAGHLSNHGDKQVLVATVLRSVAYERWVQPKDRKLPKRREMVRGVEPIREQPYCIDHASTVVPIIEPSDKMIWQDDIVDYSG